MASSSEGTANQDTGFTIVPFDPEGGSHCARVRYWSPELEDALGDINVQAIVITSSWVDQGSGIAFLKRFADQIRKLTILTGDIADLSPVTRLHQLEELSVSSPVGGIDFSQLPRLRECLLTHPSGLGNVHACPSLEDLSLFELGIADLRPLSSLKHLRSLQLHELRRLSSLEGIESLPLQEVQLKYLRKLDSVAPLTALQELRRLEIVGCKAIGDVERLGEFGSLEELRMATGPRLSSFEFIGSLTSLEELWTGNTESSSEFVSVAPLARLPSMRVLKLFDIRNAVDIDRLGELTSLQQLVINRGPDLPSLDFLRGLGDLQQFGLWKTKIVDGDLSVLLDLPSLEIVRLDPHRKHYSHTPEEIDAVFGARNPDRPHGQVRDVYWLDELGAQFESKDAMFEAAREAVEPVVKAKGLTGSFEECVILADREVRVAGRVVQGNVQVASIGRPWRNG